ncbi:MAG: ABC transporter permease [Beijerinckiaceae bacterium]
MSSIEFSPSPAPAPAAATQSRLPLLLRLALRDFHGGLSGFWIFLACLALGLAAIVGVGSVSRALSDGLAEKGRMILGGDVSFDLVQREASEAERDFFVSHGALSEIALMRAMARKADGRSGLVEIKAVDQTYPSEGEAQLDPPASMQAMLAEHDGVFGIAADAAIQAKLDLNLGDRVDIGAQAFELRALIESEPDKLAAGIGFGPRVLMSETGLRATHLLQPGALVKWLYRLRLGQGVLVGAPVSEAEVDTLVAAARAAFPEAGFEIRTRRNVSPQFSRDLDRFTQFLTLVGLTALVIGGVGIANAVQAFVERKKAAIATMKALGATGTFVTALMLVEVLLAAAIGIAAGLIAGAALPFIAAHPVSASILPFPLAPSIYPREIAAGLLYGFLTVLAFSLGPLGRAHDVPVSALFRDEVAPQRVWPRRRYLLAVAGAALTLACTIILLAGDRRLALIYLAACLGGFALLRLAAFGFMAAARRVPPPPWLELRLAIANFYRPGAVTPAVILSLGLGLTLLVALALIDGNLRHALDRGRSQETPSFFFLGIASDEAEAFRNFVEAGAAGGKVDLVPMLRGRIVALKGQSVDTVRVKDNAAWALRGDRGMTIAADAPPGTKMAEGTWWSADYKGPPIVSMDAEISAGLGLALGDEITVNVLGRNIVTRLVNTRNVDWRSFGINFLMIFPPSTFAGAPFTELATVTFPQTGEAVRGSARDSDRDMALLRAVAQKFPSVVSLRVKDALDAIKDGVDRLAIAVRAAAAVALVAATLVLGGALAAGQQTRLYEAVILKTLGATRRRLMGAFVCEFGLLGLATAIFGVLAGSLAAFAIVRFVLNLDFVWFWPLALLAAAGAMAVAILLGLAATWRVLGRKPAPYLRNL